MNEPAAWYCPTCRKVIPDEELVGFGRCLACGYEMEEENVKRTIVCLCGSTRFGEAFRQANLHETLCGRIVLSIGCAGKSDAELFDTGGANWDETKAMLDKLHLDKIALADEVLILNVGGYIGESTGRELAYARKLGKKVRFLEYLR